MASNAGGEEDEAPSSLLAPGWRVARWALRRWKGVLPAGASEEEPPPLELSSAASSSSDASADWRRLSIVMSSALTSAPADSHAVCCSHVARVGTWYSVGKTCVRHSIRYCCAIASLQLTICSRTCGRTVFLYISTSTPSSLESWARFVPTRMRSSSRSFSLASRSFTGPWCCRRTHSLFISPKLASKKATASATVPPSPSYSEPVSGSFDLEAWAR
mmetsp:Transcript_82963/g.165621  ORF Transcript_82963/g.165621 Transcript_82963/m.165621 type:complete len:217 (-) Transcript_82963:517-1167(-)